MPPLSEADSTYVDLAKALYSEVPETHKQACEI